MQTPDFPCDGGCACDAVRYRLSEDPLELHVCHCTDCQTISGTAFVMSMAIHRRSFELLRGEPALFSFETPDGKRKHHRRCTDCGCHLWSEPDRLAVINVVQAATLDDTRWLQPIAHIWTRSAQPWVSIPTDVLLYEKEAADALDLVRAWKGRSDA